MYEFSNLASIVRLADKSICTMGLNWVFAGSSNQEKVWRNSAQKVTTYIQGNYHCLRISVSFYTETICTIYIQLIREITLILSPYPCYFTYVKISYQDHERAYFDSADWALGKVLYCYFEKLKLKLIPYAAWQPYSPDPWLPPARRKSSKT